MRENNDQVSQDFESVPGEPLDVWLFRTVTNLAIISFLAASIYFGWLIVNNEYEYPIYYAVVSVVVLTALVIAKSKPKK